MHRRLTFFTILLFILTTITACSSDPSETSPAKDMASFEADATMAEDMAASAKDMTNPAVDEDMQTSPEDMATTVDMQSSPDMSSAGIDMSTPTEDMTQGQEDMTSPDMSVMEDMMPPVERPSGQCAATSDCGDERLTCTRVAVGGTCQGPCDACDAIPGADTYSCVQGSCVRDCEVDEDCALGRYCSRGRCLIERCTDNVCPVAIFGCSSPDGVCQRRSCDAMEPCPMGTTCTDGVCIE